MGTQMGLMGLVVEGVQFHDQREEKQLVNPSSRNVKFRKWRPKKISENLMSNKKVGITHFIRMFIALQLRRDSLELIFGKRSSTWCIFHELGKWIHYNKSWRSDISGKVGIIP